MNSIFFLLRSYPVDYLTSKQMVWFVYFVAAVYLTNVNVVVKCHVQTGGDEQSQEGRSVSLSSAFANYVQVQSGYLFIFGFITVVGIVISMRVAISRMYFHRTREVEVDPEEPKSKYKPVVCIHGLMDPKSSLDFFADFIREKHPGTDVVVIHLYNGLSSFTPMWKQIEKFKEEVEKISAEYPQGINLIGVSQGTLLARGVLETSSKHNVDTFISIAGPHMGQFGIPMIHWIPGYNWLRRNLYKCFYTQRCQKYSVPEYWKDPTKLDLYEQVNTFLPILNNEKPHAKSAEFKENFLRIKKLVLMGSPQDGFITPWQSSHFGYYDEQGNIVDMKNQPVYQKDTFGLRTLDEKKAIITYTIPNVPHFMYVFDETVIEDYILPNLN